MDAQTVIIEILYQPIPGKMLLVLLIIENDKIDAYFRPG